VFEIFCIENKAGVWGQNSQPPEANGGSGGEAPTPWRFYSSFKNYTIFKHCLVL